MTEFLKKSERGGFIFRNPATPIEVKLWNLIQPCNPAIYQIHSPLNKDKANTNLHSDGYFALKITLHLKESFR